MATDADTGRPTADTLRQATVCDMHRRRALGSVLLATAAAWARANPATSSVGAVSPAHTPTGPWARSHVFDLPSRHTGQRYRILVGLPLSPPSTAGHPVLWALDGLASFPLIALQRPRTPSPQDSTLLQQRDAGVADGLLVGIGYASGEPFDMHARALDCTAAGEGPTGDLLSPQHGGAKAFTRFLVEELRPLIAAAWPLDPRRHTLFGFSYGGLFTVQLLCRAPQHFQRWWAASPSLWFRGHAALSPWSVERPAPDFCRWPAHVRLTVGRDEQYPDRLGPEAMRQRLQSRRMVDNAQAMAALLSERSGVDLRLELAPGRDHLDMLAHGARGVWPFAFNSRRDRP